MSRRCDLVNVSVMSGNKVSHSNRKTKRKFVPNLKQVSLASEAIGANVNLKIAASTLRTINKYGSIDNFIINYRYGKLSDIGKKLRNKVTKSLEKKGELANVKIAKTSKAKKVASVKK